MPDDKFLSTYEQTRLSMRPTIFGSRYMIVSGHYLASQAGMRILDRGGNAIDAGVAAGTCLGVLQSDMVNFAGVAPILIYHAKTKSLICIDGLGTWPKAASVDYFIQNWKGKLPEGLPRTVVPAAPDAWITALHMFGTMSFEDVTKEAVNLAENGFPMHQFLYNDLIELREKYLQWEENAKIYLPQDRMPPEPGKIFVQKDLAETIKKMIRAEQKQRHKGRERGLMAARDEFYKGEIARTITDYHAKNNGLLTYEDMSEFKVKIEPPLKVQYKEYTVFSCGPWCQGPALLQALNLLENYDVKSLGHNSPEYIHLVIEALKLVFADRERYYGDPDFIKVPVTGLLSKDYARDRKDLIDFSRAWREMPPAGNPWLYEPEKDGILSENKKDYAAPKPNVADNNQLDTSYVCVFDQYGNAFSATPSDMSYTTEIIPTTGLAVSARGAQSWVDKDHASSIEGGKRPRLTPNPSIIFKNDRPYMILGTPGGDTQCQSMVQVFLNIVEFGMDPQLAVEQPRFATFNFPNSFYPHDYQPGMMRIENRVPENTLKNLKEKGHKVELWPGWSWKSGGVCMIIIDPDANVLKGAADPRRESYALGW
jgi:gamma-glutamyltranspeptidase / glutathione hydrolase